MYQSTQSPYASYSSQGSFSTPPQQYDPYRSQFGQSQQSTASPQARAQDGQNNSYGPYGAPQQQTSGYLPGFLTASQSGRTPVPGTYDPATAKKTESLEDFNPFANQPPLFNTSIPKPTPPAPRLGGSLWQRNSPHTPRDHSSPLAFSSTSKASPSGNSPPSDEDAPPVISQSDLVPFPLNRQPKAASTAVIPVRPASSDPAPAEVPIKLIIFGYPADKVNMVLQHFAGLGEVVGSEPGPEYGNWVVISYKNDWEARRIVRRNGELFEGTWRVGVAYLDPSQADAISTDISTGAVMSSTPNMPRTSFRTNNTSAADPSTPSAPVLRSAPSRGPLVPPASALRPTPSRSSFGGLANMVGGLRGTSEAAAVTAADKLAHAPPAAVPTAPAEPGVLGRVADFVFGW